MPTVQNLALDTLVNLAPYIVLPAEDDNFSVVSLLFDSVHKWLLSNDKLAIVRGEDTQAHTCTSYMYMTLIKVHEMHGCN